MELDRKQRYVLAAQTTQDKGEFLRICAWMRERSAETPCLDTICDATARRQQEVLDIAAKVDGMIVVGGRQSGNTRRLAALACGCGVQTRHVETPEELDGEWLRRKAVVGLTAGASTPKDLISRTQLFLEGWTEHNLNHKGEAMTITAMMINQQDDNVGVVTTALKKGQLARFRQADAVEEVELRDDVPIYHKFCVRSIKKGEPVIKYGEQLGLATRDIAPGDYVHTHNLVSQREQ
jgi:hypothetical protein